MFFIYQMDISFPSWVKPDPVFFPEYENDAAF